ncbi:chitobiase/beta-hexosaminidase C-terminal domain-containing protein [Nitrososphaera viennensis]|nr:chitobiase/beta-hexosaminidase C-terminal domain-containing protein [Nitrososphaera viennensis]UVS68152.1 chitobiase/beta-hexosaminidase C-terminal domain-containing protein [Nitrososphaera viennensis]
MPAGQGRTRPRHGNISAVWAVAAAFMLVFGMISAPISVRAATIPGACNCVIFRLDDIQDFWLNTVQIALMNHFIAKGERLGVGVIMNFIGNDPSVVDKVGEGLNSGTFELVSHAWNHVDHRTLTPQEQHDTLQQANQKMTSLWGSSAVAFIPPFNAYDDNTLAALEALDMKIISAEFDQELPSIYNPDEPASPDNKVYKAIPDSDISDSHGIYHLPQVIGFYTYDSEPPTKTSMNTMTSRIDEAISSYGYAVVTLHPQDFAVKDSSQNPTNQISSSELADLDTLIENIQSRGYSIKTYSEAIGSSSAPEEPSSEDTAAPQITAPPDITTEATGVRTPVSLGSPTVRDNRDSSPHVSNNAPGGASESEEEGGFPVGTTTVTWTATDDSGNSASATQNVTITDTTAPSIPTPLSPEDDSNVESSETTFEWTEATDLASQTVTYDLLVADNPDFDAPVAISQTGLVESTYTANGSEPLPGGTYYWKVRASDSSGNESPYSDVYTFTVGGSNSSSSSNGIAVTASPPGGTYGPPLLVTLTASPPSSTGTAVVIYYTTDGSTPTTSSAAYSEPVLVSSDTVLKFFAQDTSSGTASAVITHTYSIDATAPTVSASPAGGTYTSVQSVTLAPSESTATIYYTTDGSDPTTTSGTVYSAPIPIATTTMLKFIAKDNAGNISPVVIEEYVINHSTGSSGSSGSGGGGFVGGGGGGGGGGGSSSGGSFTTDGQVFTYADSHFVQHPLDRIKFVSYGTMNMQNIVLTSVKPGQQVNISATFKNYQNSAQDYVYITQVEKDGVTYSVNWATGAVNAGQTETASRSWMPEEPGDYTIKVFVWDKLSGSPIALSDVGESRISVPQQFALPQI